MVTVISMTQSVDRWNSLAEVTPLHVRVSTFLLHGLNNGDYPRNRPLPSSRVLAEQLGVKPNTVYRWESDRMRISAEQLQALTVILDTPAAAIVLPDPKKGTPPTALEP